MIEITATANGVAIPVHAQPGARRNGIVGVHDDRLKIAVTQVAEKGKANKEIAKVLADALGVNKSSVAILSGETSSRKVLEVTGMTIEEVREKLAHLIGPTER